MLDVVVYIIAKGKRYGNTKQSYNVRVFFVNIQVRPGVGKNVL